MEVIPHQHQKTVKFSNSPLHILQNANETPHFKPKYPVVQIKTAPAPSPTNISKSTK